MWGSDEADGRPARPCCSSGQMSTSGMLARMDKVAVPYAVWPLGVKVVSVRSLTHLCLAAVVCVLCPPAHSETLRCNGHIVETGDSRLSVRYHCGEPLLQDSYCAPVYYAPGFQRVPEPFASTVIPCLVVDEWLYDRGPGNLVATVRFRAGIVRSITYGTRAAP